MLAALSCTVSFGCADATPASVGSRGEVIDLHECFAVDCTRTRTPAVQNELAAADPSRVKECEPYEAPPVRIVWSRLLRDRPCAPLGFCTPNVVRFAPDGSFWTASATGTPLESASSERAGVFLAHYSQDNAVLAEKVIGTWTLPHVSSPSPGRFGDGAVLAIAPQESNHVLVTLAWNETDAQSNPIRSPAWIAEYDSNAVLIGEQKSIAVLPPSIVSIAPDADGGVYYLASSGAYATENDAWGASKYPLHSTAVVAKLDSNLRLEWTQAQAPDTAGEVLGTDDGRAVLLDSSEWQVGTVSWWGDDGGSEHELGLPFDTDVVSLVAGGVLLRDKSAPPSVTYREVSRSGEERWATRVIVEPVLEGAGLGGLSDQTFLLSSAEAVTPGGSIVRIATFNNPSGSPLTAIFRLEPSHETCNFSRLIDGENGAFYQDFVDQFVVDRGGAISYHTTAPLSGDQVDQSFGTIDWL
jgi:hypothetical protein